MATVQSNPQAGASRAHPNADGHTPRPESAPAPTNGSLLFAEDVATLVGMTKEWIYAETRAGRIPHVTLGRYYRYRPESIDTWLREIERGAVSAPRDATERH